MRQLLDSSTWHQQQLIQLAAFITPPTHSGLFHSWNEQFPPQEYLKEWRILLFQRDLCNYQAVYLFKKGNYYFLFYNNCICFKSVYVHDKVICFSAGFSYSVLMWPRFAVGKQRSQCGVTPIYKKIHKWKRIKWQVRYRVWGHDIALRYKHCS